MKEIFALAGALIMLLDVLGALSWTEPFLPIGGSHIAQIAIVLGLAFVINEVMTVVNRAR